MRTGTYTRVDNGNGCRPDYIYHSKSGKNYTIEQDATYTKEYPSTWCEELHLEAYTMKEMREAIRNLGI